MDIQNLSELIDDRYVEGSKCIHSIFSSEAGKRSLVFLEELFLSGGYDRENPSHRALYNQGQSSVLHEIKDMIRKIDTGFYDNKTSQ